MKKLLKLSAGIVALTLAHASFAATSSYTVANLAPNVVMQNTSNSNYWAAPVAVPTGATITSVSWNIGLYTNGATSQTYQVCWAQYNTMNYTKCIDASANLVATSNFFNGLNGKGRFKITGILVGGTYPVYPHHNNSLTVNYQY